MLPAGSKCYPSLNPPPVFMHARVRELAQYVERVAAIERDVGVLQVRRQHPAPTHSCRRPFRIAHAPPSACPIGLYQDAAELGTR